MRSIAHGEAPRLLGTGLAFLFAAATVWPAPWGRPEAASCAAGARGEEPPRPTPCCFVNPAYAGVCVVKPSKDETCASILAYLNNPRSAGKIYCNNTTLRGNWRLVVCEKSSEPQERSAGDASRQPPAKPFGAERR